MTTTTEPVVTAPQISPRQGRARAGLCALGVAVIGGGWWLSHPTTVGGDGWVALPAPFTDAIGSTTGASPAVGETTVINTGVGTRSVDGDPRNTVPITLGAAGLRLVENTADADVELVLCRHAGDGTDLIGVVDGADIDSYCTAVLPPTGERAAFPVDAQLVVTITPHQPGTVRVDGVDLTYRDGIRLGNVHTGSTIISTTR